MQNRIIVFMFALIVGLALSTAAFAQTELAPPGWKTCPHCLTHEQQMQVEKINNTPGLPFNPHSIDGVWNSRPDNPRPNQDIIETSHNAFAKQGPMPPNVPPLTPLGKKMFDATATDFKSPEGTNVTNSKDGMLKCDPLGWPRWFSYNYGLEFITLPDRVLMFIEWGHTWRTIWTDGRKLPADPPEPRWLGYAVGHWDGDTFIVESNGYDDRSWISEATNVTVDPNNKSWGLRAWPHTDEMKITERWRRTSYGILEGQITVTDPKVYTKPWTTDVAKHTYLPNTELWEYFCVPSDSNYFNERVVKPSNGAK